MEFVTRSDGAPRVAVRRDATTRAAGPKRGADWRAGTVDDDEILARLFRLNQQRSGAT